MKIVVIGGTGLIGTNLVNRLRNKGHDALAASPNTGVNTLTGEGLDEAELQEQFVRAPGPGGQNVNKVATAVQLKWDLEHSRSRPSEG